MESDQLPENRFFSSFDKHEDLLKAQNALLSVDCFAGPNPDEDTKEITHLLVHTTNIISQYQEQAYLLDPYLEDLVKPVIEWLKAYAVGFTAGSRGRGSDERVRCVATLLYHYIKFRGHKTIIRFFPHEVSDLTIVVDFMTHPESLVHVSYHWALRFALLSWLSLICMLPFDLSQFDATESRGKTADQIEAIGTTHLSKAGVEREGSALLLSRLYMRKDTLSRWSAFLDSCFISDIFTSLGKLHVLCEVAKSGPPNLLQGRNDRIFDLATAFQESETLNANTAVRKYRLKLVSRLALRLLPGQARKRKKGRVLDGSAELEELVEDPGASEHSVSEGVELALEQLFNGLQDKDTIVRWSAAKGVARIAERLPSGFVDQVVDTVLDLFSIHSIASATLYDIPAIAEATWHGACLCCAELARRGLISASKLPVLIEWLYKALLFDLRKGAHSIGANVRDAAAYVVWALARVHDPSVLAPFANKLAEKLVCVSLFDREIQIRRAASAAFQEHAGRTNLFPQGIEVLRKTDFYAVGVRRNSFLRAAPAVASHAEYQKDVLDHILDITLRHWDQAMRELAAQSLHLICMLDLDRLAPAAITKIICLLESTDVLDIHGGLLALAEVAFAYNKELSGSLREEKLKNLFHLLVRIPHETVVGSRNHLVTASACRLIAGTLTLSEIEAGSQSSQPKWQQIVDFGVKHRNPTVQEAAALALGSMSRLTDFPCTLMRELKTGSPFMQQSLGHILGALDYNAHPNGVHEAIVCLLDCVDPSSKIMKSNVEGRRNCYSAMPKILLNTLPRLTHHLSVNEINSLLNSLLTGLEDYTIDERGDVGSWIRISCVHGLATFAETLITHSLETDGFEYYLSSDKYHAIIAGILKQGVEKLDNVRQQSGLCFMRLLNLESPKVGEAIRWRPDRDEYITDLFRSSDEVSWSDGGWLFPRAIKLLEVEKYRSAVLKGVVASLSTKTDVTQKAMSSSLSLYVASLPLESSSSYCVSQIIDDLLTWARSQLKSNTAVIPILQTFNVLLSDDTLKKCSDSDAATSKLEGILRLATKHVEKYKNTQRIHECMKIVSHLLSFKSVREECIRSLGLFLAHRFPTIRADTAEFLYNQLQSADVGKDTEEAEEILLETEWSSTDMDSINEASNKFVELLLA